MIGDTQMIKLPKFIFKLDQKGWFRGLGLHHASIALIPLSAGLLLAHFDMETLGAFITAWGSWWYASKEWGGQVALPKTFEVMDFVSPFIVAISFFVLKSFV